MAENICDTLTEQDIPGAILNEPLERATVPSLKWWLVYCGIKPQTSWRKDKLIQWYVCLFIEL